MASVPRSSSDGHSWILGIIVAGWLLYQTSQVLFYGIGIVLAAVILAGLAIAGGGRKATLAAIVVAAMLTGAIALGWRSVIACLVASTTWLIALALSKRFLIHSKEGFGRSVVKNGLELAIILSFVTAVLVIISYWLSWFPPDRIVDWGEQIEPIKHRLEMIAMYASEGLAAVGVLYLWLARMGRSTGHLAPAWKTVATARTWVKRAALALTVLASFSFTATGTADGPIVELTRQRAQAVKNYADLTWSIALQLNREIKLQLVSATYGRLPQEIQAALAQESNLESQRAQIPNVYFQREAPERQTAAQLLRWTDPRPQRRADWTAGMHTAAETLQKREEPPKNETPPTGSSIREIGKAQSKVNRAAEEFKPPKWLEGPGEDVAKHLFDFATPADALPVMKSLAESFPLLAEIVSIGLDAGKEALFPRVKESAVKIARDAMRVGAGSIPGNLKQAVLDLAPPLPSISWQRINEWRRILKVRTVEVAGAGRRLEADLAPQLDQATNAADGFTKKMTDLEVPEPREARGLRMIGYLDASSPTIEALRTQVKRLNICRQSVVLAMANYRVPDDKARDLLGPEYDLLRSKADAVVRQREAIREAREAELRELRREMDHEVRVP